MGLARPLEGLNVTHGRTHEIILWQDGRPGRDAISGTDCAGFRCWIQQPLQQLILQYTTQLVSTPVPLERHV